MRFHRFEKFVEERKAGRVACFTGHRPSSFPFKYNEKADQCVKIKKNLRFMIETAGTNGFSTFISGMALGVDTWAAEEVLFLRDSGLWPDFKLLLAIPCQGQTNKWLDSAKERYGKIAKASDGWMYVYDRPYEGPKDLTDRNIAMINSSELTIAVYKERSGSSGTKHALNYTKKAGNTIFLYDYVADERNIYKKEV